MTPALLDAAIDAHGGWDRWRAVERVRLSIDLRPNIFATRFTSPARRRFTFTASTRAIHAVVDPLTRDGLRGVFSPDEVRIEDASGRVVSRRAIVRDRNGRVPRRAIWDDLDVAYFLGYALWNYTTTPYVLAWPGMECREGPAWRHVDGASWRTLHVRYPAGFPTHCRDQVFYFDDRFLLQRLDYTADVFGPLARGAHYCEDYQRFDGLAFATHRIGYPRRLNGQPLPWPRVIEGWIRNAQAEA